MEQTAPKQNRFVRWAVVVGIVVVLNIFFVVVRSLVIPEPQLQDFCPAATSGAMATDLQSCDAQGGVWTETGTPMPAPTLETAPATAPAGYCDFYAKCQPVYDAATAKYDLYAFSLLLVFGLIAVVIGVFVPLGSAIVATGLSYGGVLAFVVASIMYWNEAGNWVRLLISAIALAALLYIGWKRFKD